jgi:hypothetical protein
MCFEEKLLQIGYRKPAAMLAGGGPGIPGRTIRKIMVGEKRPISPESVATPHAYGVTSDKQYMGGYGWTYSEMFSHVKTRGHHGMEVI